VTSLASELAQSANPDDRDHYGYGSGRRLCPGIHLAERNMFLAMAKLLWAFDFAPEKDEKTGKEVEIDTDPTTGYSEGFLVCAKKFGLSVKARGEGRRKTILREFEEGKRDVLDKFED
jgi:cytochrome P450 family 619